MNQIEELNKACSMAEKAGLELMKSHIKAYTRANGSVVQEHDDSRQAKRQFHHDEMLKHSGKYHEAKERGDEAAAEFHRDAVAHHNAEREGLNSDADIKANHASSKAHDISRKVNGKGVSTTHQAAASAHRHAASVATLRQTRELHQKKADEHEAAAKREQ